MLLLSIALFLLVFFALGWIWGAGYEPTNRSIRKQLMGLLEQRFQSGERFVFYDLGSGFGGVLMDIAEKFPGAICTGIEADWIKYAIGRRRIRKLGYGARVMLVKGDLLKLYFSDADVLYMFLSPWILKRQEFRDRMRALKPGCLIVSYSHKIPGLDPAVVIGKKLFVYSRITF